MRADPTSLTVFKNTIQGLYGIDQIANESSYHKKREGGNSTIVPVLRFYSIRSMHMQVPYYTPDSDISDISDPCPSRQVLARQRDAHTEKPCSAGSGTRPGKR